MASAHSLLHPLPSWYHFRIFIQIQPQSSVILRQYRVSSDEDICYMLKLNFHIPTNAENLFKSTLKLYRDPKIVCMTGVLENHRPVKSKVEWMKEGNEMKEWIYVKWSRNAVWVRVVWAVPFCKLVFIMRSGLYFIKDKNLNGSQLAKMKTSIPDMFRP